MKDKKVIASRIMNILSWVSIVFALFFIGFSVIASHSGEQNAKEIFGVKAYIVNSDSMSKSEISQNEEIFFNSGDVILVKRPENVLLLKEGDVITFVSTASENYGQTITHKIREIVYSADGDLEGFVTYGIYTGVNDGAVVLPENVTGVYMGKVANIGSVFSFLKTPRGYFLSILTPLVLVIIFFSIKIGRFVERRLFDKGGLIINGTAQENPTMQYGKQEVMVTVKVVVENGNLSAISSESKPLINEIEEDKPLEELNAYELTKNEITQETQGEDMPQTIEEKIEAFSKTKVVKIPVSEKILGLDENVQNYFAKVHNELISYKKVNSRVSLRCVSYRIGRKLIAKASVRGKTLLFHFALDVNGFDKNLYFQRDLSNLKAYAEVPFTVKLKSARGEKRALALVGALAIEQNLNKKTKEESVDVLRELKNFNK